MNPLDRVILTTDNLKLVAFPSFARICKCKECNNEIKLECLKVIPDTFDVLRAWISPKASGNLSLDEKIILFKAGDLFQSKHLVMPKGYKVEKV